MNIRNIRNKNINQSTNTKQLQKYNRVNCVSCQVLPLAAKACHFCLLLVSQGTTDTQPGS